MTDDPTARLGPPRLFAYGTLAPGGPNEHVLADVSGTWQPATLTGRLVQDGWGAVLGYPALALDPDATDRVDGMLLTSAALQDHWDRLDTFEGDNYERVTVEVTTDGSTRLPAQAYVLRRALA